MDDASMAEDQSIPSSSSQFIKSGKQFGKNLSKKFYKPLNSQNPFRGEREAASLTSLAAEALLLFEAYAGALATRDLDSDQKIHIKQLRKAYTQLYYNRPREKYLAELNNVFEEQHCDGFLEVFRKVLDDMDTQFAEIHKSRKELFKWDVLGLDAAGIDIIVHENLCTDLVDWIVNEPKIMAKDQDKTE